MASKVCEILDIISQKSPINSKKINKEIENANTVFLERFESFLIIYQQYLTSIGKSLEYAVDSYLKVCADYTYEQIRFIETGEYSNKSFEDVNQRIYSDPEIMGYHINGLALAQYLWRLQYERFDYFAQTYSEYANSTKKYLEIGAGHGTYVLEAMNQSNSDTLFDIIDISNSSLEMTKYFVGDSKNITYHLIDIFDFNPDTKYDFITMGEVLEHVEKPLELLQQACRLLNDDGVCFITTPANSPAIDHIYLFRNKEEIVDLLNAAKLEVIDDIAMFDKNISPEKAMKYKYAMMYAAFLKKRTIKENSFLS